MGGGVGVKLAASNRYRSALELKDCVLYPLSAAAIFFAELGGGGFAGGRDPSVKVRLVD